MAPGEKTIYCCGASSWCKFIAWRDIVESVLCFILSIIVLSNGRTIAQSYQLGPQGPEALKVAGTFSMLISLLCFAFSIVLLKGTSQKRVGFLKAWLIFEIVCLILIIVGTVFNVIVGGMGVERIPTLYLGLGSIVGMVFGIYVVSIHKKEINAGVFSSPV